MDLSGSSEDQAVLRIYAVLCRFVKQFFKKRGVLGIPLYMDLLGSFEGQAVLSIPLYADLSSSSEDQAVLSIPLYTDLLGSSEA